MSILTSKNHSTSSVNLTCAIALPFSSSLKDTLVAYMERKNLDIPPDVEEFFPEEIDLSQYVEAWKLAVALKRERSQR